MHQMFNVLIYIILTIILFLMMRKIYARFSTPALHPVLTTTIVIIVILVNANIPYETYMQGGKWIDALLGPSVVAFSYPLYKQRKALIKFRKAILIGVCTGLVVAMITIYLFAKLIGVDMAVLFSLIPKSITTPVAIQISAGFGGISSMTVAFVMIAGFTGVILGPILMKYSGIHSKLGKGLALGSGSHALGVAKSSEYGEFCLSMSTVAMTLSAIIGSVVGPAFVWFIQRFL